MGREEEGWGSEGEVGAMRRCFAPAVHPPAPVPTRPTVMLCVVVRAWMSAMLFLRWKARLKAALVAPRDIHVRPARGEGEGFEWGAKQGADQGAV